MSPCPRCKQSWLCVCERGRGDQALSQEEIEVITLEERVRERDRVLAELGELLKIQPTRLSDYPRAVRELQAQLTAATEVGVDLGKVARDAQGFANGATKVALQTADDFDVMLERVLEVLADFEGWYIHADKPVRLALGTDRALRIGHLLADLRRMVSEG